MTLVRMVTPLSKLPAISTLSMVGASVEVTLENRNAAREIVGSWPVYHSDSSSWICYWETHGFESYFHAGHICYFITLMEY